MDIFTIIAVAIAIAVVSALSGAIAAHHFHAVIDAKIAAGKATEATLVARVQALEAAVVAKVKAAEAAVKGAL